MISAEQKSLTAELNSANEVMQALPVNLPASTNSTRQSPGTSKTAMVKEPIKMGSYRQHALDGASAVDLVVALYDGIVRFSLRCNAGR